MFQNKTNVFLVRRNCSDTAGIIDQMMVRLEVYETEIDQIRVGGNVTVTATALPHAIVGAVEHIRSTVKKQSVVSAFPASNTDARMVGGSGRDRNRSHLSRHVNVDLRHRRNHQFSDDWR